MAMEMADWAKIDVGFLRHPQVVQLKPVEQLGYLAMILYSQEYETDGEVPVAALRTCGVGDKDVSQMEKAGLVTKREDVWMIDGFTRKQSTKAELDKRRDAARQRRRSQ